MYITYCKSSAIKYATRNRYKSLPTLIQADANTQLEDGYYRSEIQRKVLLGDGVNTSVKTSSLNICDYVLIAKDDEDNNPTRWFVVLFNYLNGGQIELQLRRDVIGEFGIVDTEFYGKIIRGYLPNDNILINRKELSVNEILKDRVHLKPESFLFDKYKIESNSIGSQNDDQLYGLLYFTKKASKNTLYIDVPSFTKVNLDLKYEPNASCRYLSKPIQFSFTLRIYKAPANTTGSPYHYKNVNCMINFKPSVDNQWYYSGKNVDPDDNYDESTIEYTRLKVDEDTSSYNDFQFDGFIRNLCESICDVVANNYISNYSTISEHSNVVQMPEIMPVFGSREEIEEYQNEIVKNNDTDNYYSCTVGSSDIVKENESGLNYDNYVYIVKPVLTNAVITIAGGSLITVDIVDPNNSITNGLGVSQELTYTELYVYYSGITPSAANALEINYPVDIVDEPFYIMCIPLFNCTIKDENDILLYTLRKEDMFYAYNNLIKGLSGENPYIIDAQIVSYCPNLHSLTSLDNGLVGDDRREFPLFYLSSSYYERDCKIEFTADDNASGIYEVNTNVKKEYTKRNFSIVSPEQSGKIVFNFYDYVRDIPEYLDKITITFTVKIALKPYSLIASCIINRIKDGNKDPLQGITYESDLRGCQPNSGGFQASLASDAFQTYKRQNSNYQQIFNKQQERVLKEQSIERLNEKVQGVANTLSMTMMGAIAGAQMSDAGLLNMFGTKAAGAAIGATVAGGSTAALMTAQYFINEDMRKYEYAYNQEMFDLNIGTVKNLPDSVNRISSFNEIILKDFWFTLELYECTETESAIIDEFFNKYGYEVGIYDDFKDYIKDYTLASGEKQMLLKGTLLTSNLNVNLHNVAQKELEGGVYYYAK